MADGNATFRSGAVQVARWRGQADATTPVWERVWWHRRTVGNFGVAPDEGAPQAPIGGKAKPYPNRDQERHPGRTSGCRRPVRNLFVAVNETRFRGSGMTPPATPPGPLFPRQGQTPERSRNLGCVPTADASAAGVKGIPVAFDGPPALNTKGT